jgi:adenosylhomocysteine nucleosidase
MGAMPEEVEQIIPAIQNLKKSEIGNRIFYKGTINNINVVVAFSKW